MPCRIALRRMVGKWEHTRLESPGDHSDGQREALQEHGEIAVPMPTFRQEMQPRGVKTNRARDGGT